MHTPQELKQILSDYHIRPKKRWGQNFLIDKNILHKIIEAADLSRKDRVLEIGPGLGALTFELAGRVKQIMAVEIDRGLSAALKQRSAGYSNIDIIEGDILKFDIASYTKEKVRVVGNLPYYITTPIITHLLGQKSVISSMLITVQKEVAERLVAGPGTKKYGAISVFVQFHTRPQIIRRIKNTAFFPQPDVDSALMRLDILERPSIEVRQDGIFFKLVRTAFAQRRKTILTSLSKMSCIKKDQLLLILEGLKIDPKRRPETLSLDDFARLTNCLSRQGLLKRGK